VTYRMEDVDGPYLLISERHEMDGNPDKSLFLVMMAVIVLRGQSVDPPEHDVPKALPRGPTLSTPAEPITHSESVHLLRYVRRIPDHDSERTRTNDDQAPSLSIKYHFQDVPYQATLTFHRTHPPPSSNHPPDPTFPPILLTKLLDFGVTGVVYLARLGDTAIAAKQALEDAMYEIAHEADIYLMLNNTDISGRGVPVYFGMFVRDDETFMLTSYCGISFDTWQRMWFPQLYVNFSPKDTANLIVQYSHSTHPPPTPPPRHLPRRRSSREHC
jgi:hypothetical protein